MYYSATWFSSFLLHAISILSTAVRVTLFKCKVDIFASLLISVACHLINVEVKVCNDLQSLIWTGPRYPSMFISSRLFFLLCFSQRDSWISLDHTRQSPKTHHNLCLFLWLGCSPQVFHSLLIYLLHFFTLMSPFQWIFKGKSYIKGFYAVLLSLKNYFS